MNQAQRTAEVAKKEYSYGAWLSEAEIKSIGAYLAVVYGTAKATDRKILQVSDAHNSDVSAVQSETTSYHRQ